MLRGGPSRSSERMVTSPDTTSDERCVMRMAAGEGSRAESSERHGAKEGISAMSGPTSTATPRNERRVGSATAAPRRRRQEACIA